MANLIFFWMLFIETVDKDFFLLFLLKKLVKSFPILPVLFNKNDKQNIFICKSNKNMKQQQQEYAKDF